MYKKPLQEAKDSIMSDKEVKDIFSNIENIFQFNKKLMRDLERTKNSDEKTIADVFLQNAPMMKLYSEYINNFEISTETLQECRNNRSALRALIDVC